MLASIFILCGILSNGIFAWESLPDIPSGRRSEYYALNENGQYKYGYDTGDGIAAKQSGDASNQVEGHYFYKLSNGNDFDLKYSAGIQGFVPEKLSNRVTNPASTDASKSSGENLLISNGSPNSANNYFPSGNPTNVIQPGSVSGAAAGTLAHGSLNLDGSYAFGFNTDDQSRKESADASNNVQGSYSYKNTAGTHDLSYVAGPQTGFKPTGGSLSIPNGLLNSAGNNPQSGGPVTSIVQPGSTQGGTTGTLAYGSLNLDGSYAFGFKTDDQSRQESADASNNVQGSYSYKNTAGTHDLSYVAGSQTGFKPTGGSLSIPNGLSNSAGTNSPSGGPITSVAQSASSSGAAVGNLAYGALNSDGSYSFKFATDDQTRQESADANNNVQGSYSYKNTAGIHDLSYVAGSETGFKPTGGSLSIPNGLPNLANNNRPSGGPTAVVAPVESSLGPAAHTLAYGSLNSDGSYAFSFKTDDQSRRESADANNNVQGSYSYRNSAGSHDLSYTAGSETGFKPTGGSLSIPNGLLNSASNNLPSRGSTTTDAQLGSSPGSAAGTLAYGSLNADGSYAFEFKTDEQFRQESGDAHNNVQGSYSYKNSAGTHDLSYIAGSKTGFKPTGGSLSVPNGLLNSADNKPPSGNALPTVAQSGSPSVTSAGTLAFGSLNPDGSYTFGFKTNDQSRQESADASNNVEGSYSYKNSAGTHDLSYIAGSKTGFKPTGGSLSVPNGLTNSGNDNVQGRPMTSLGQPESTSVNAAGTLAYGSLNPDGSYAFEFQTKDQSRKESADADNNVEGNYSYKNTAGTHDLSYVAGAETGFKPTGGGLSIPNGLQNSIKSNGNTISSSTSVQFDSSSQNTAGILTHSFLNTDGVSIPNGLPKSAFSQEVTEERPSGSHLPQIDGNGKITGNQDTKFSYNIGNLAVHTYLPPSNEKHKFGYIFDTKS